MRQLKEKESRTGCEECSASECDVLFKYKPETEIHESLKCPDNAFPCNGNVDEVWYKNTLTYFVNKFLLHADWESWV